MSAIAIIPARGGSKRIPRKNIHPFRGRPMLAWPIEAALKSAAFDRVIVSTEDREIADIARQEGAQVADRPPEMASDSADELGACLHLLDALRAREEEPEFFCVVYPTAVLLQPEDFRKSFALLDGKPQADVVMGVSAYPIHPYKALVKNDDGYLSAMFPAECALRSQFHPPVWASNGTLYWFRTQAFRREKTYYPPRLVPYILPPERAVDIDVPEDLDWAEKMADMAERSK